VNRIQYHFILLILSVIFFLGCKSELNDPLENNLDQKIAVIPTILEVHDDISVTFGQSEPLYVIAKSEDGGTLSYQWYSKIDDESLLIQDANEATYIPPVFEAGEFIYFCKITNSLDGAYSSSVDTREIKFTVLSQVDIQESELKTKYGVSRCGEPVILQCSVISSNPNLSVSYQWYKSVDGTLENGTIIDGANGSEFKTDRFVEKGIFYYCCVVTESISDNGDGGVKSLTRTIPFSVIYTALPVIEIETENEEEPTAEYVSPPAGCYGAGLKNATKVHSRMKIFVSGTDEAVFDSGDYIKNESGLTIKLRGNTSAYGKKKPYKLKLQKEADLLENLISGRDSSYAHKEWILLRDGTSLRTFIGMAVADLAGTPWTPEFAFVNVVINGDYRGLYLLIEAVSRGEKRINVAEDGYIIERDAYWWNEDVKFITPLYNQKYTFKYPDDDKITTEQLNYIYDYMNTLELHVKDGTYEDYLDVESFARWLLIHDILGTWDSGGSNVYMTKYDSSDNSKIFMSTTWDYDSNYRMVNTWANQHNGSRIYAYYLINSENLSFKNSYKSQWNNLSSSLWAELFLKLDDLKNEWGEDINISKKGDAVRYNYDISPIEDEIASAQEWFTSRMTWLDSAIGDL